MIPTLTHNKSKLIYYTIQDEFNHRMKLYKTSISKQYFENLTQQNQLLEEEYDEVIDGKINFQIPHQDKHNKTGNTEYLQNLKP